MNTVLYKFIKDLNYGQHTVIQFDYYQASDCEIVVNYSDNRTNLDSRGGWTRAELHHGSILQNASVYTISHAVRTSERQSKIR